MKNKFIFCLSKACFVIIMKQIKVMIDSFLRNRVMTDEGESLKQVANKVILFGRDFLDYIERDIAGQGGCMEDSVNDH